MSGRGLSADAGRRESHINKRNLNPKHNLNNAMPRQQGMSSMIRTRIGAEDGVPTAFMRDFAGVYGCGEVGV